MNRHPLEYLAHPGFRVIERRFIPEQTLMDHKTQTLYVKDMYAFMFHFPTKETFNERVDACIRYAQREISLHIDRKAEGAKNKIFWKTHNLLYDKDYFLL